MAERQRKPWLNGAVGYEIYTRSFSDTSESGFGDLRGIAEKLEYVSWLGADIVWLTPIYPSPDHDHGYDVADYTSVRSDHGTVADVEALVEKAHSLDLKVLLDIVPNHTSIEHEWFRKAIADPESAERAMYLFRDPSPEGGPPNNWISHFGGPAWTMDEASGQYYCHLFLPEQPDLDWRNPDVLDAFDDIYRFWFERGIDGFRIDVAHGLLKHPSFADNPRLHDVGPDAGPLATFFSFDHKYDMDQDDNVEIFGRWQAIADEYDATLVAESGVTDHHRLARYVGPDALDLSFFLKPGWLEWDPAVIVSEHLDLAEIEPSGISWVISNHDQPRPVSRLTRDDPTCGHRNAKGLARSLAVTTLQMVLGGVPFLYYGEELGLPDAVIDPERREDPVATRNDTDGGEARDVARSPMPWDCTPFNGFSAVEPWIASEDRPEPETVKAQRADPSSPLYRYRSLLQTRRAHPDMHAAPFERLESPSDEVAVVRRGSVLVIANLSADEVAVTSAGDGWDVAFVSTDGSVTAADGAVTVGPERSVILSASS